MGLGGAISNLLSLGAKLLPAVAATAQAPSSSSSPPVDQNHQIQYELDKLMRMLERINATLYDAEQRETTDSSVKLWLKELKGVAYRAEDVLGEYHYEVLRAQVEARDATPPDSRKRKLIQVPSGMLDQIQQIRSSFDEISNDRIKLQLSEGDGPMRCNNELQIAQTSHLVVQSDIFGREREKEKLIDLLSSGCGGVSVVTIVGMGGIGKTTLAQLAYNDQRIRQRFDKFGWICVSGDFNVERHTKESVESITGNECGLTNLSAMQEKIQKKISGKRVLLVLDDVWNEKKSLWDSFQAPFMSATFAKILVTTRNDHVGQIMQTETTLNLGYLSAEQCWLLFEHYAFGGVKQNKDPKLVEIGKQIMNKCGLLPLAVKSIASLLRHEGEEENWRDILESELWESNVKSEIFSPLQISYARLPTYLKSCFLYCSMFPKNYEYYVEELVKLWICQGFIVSKGNKTVDKIGFEYALQLCQRSLFERADKYQGEMVTFKLHDIVHDLARVNSENSCYSIEFDKVPIFPNVLYHLSIVPSRFASFHINPTEDKTLCNFRSMGLGGVISNLLSLGAKLLPAVAASAQAPYSSSSPPVDQNHQIEAELKKMMRMLELIKAMLYDAEQREIRDSSFKLWLKELKGVAYCAEDVLDDFHYEVLRARVEARDAFPADYQERMLIQVPSGMLDQIQKIRSSFDEISNYRIAVQLSDGDGPLRCNNELQIAQTSHLVVQSDIFGRESEKEKLIDLLSSESEGVSVVTIVGMGGIGKTTVAQLACNDQRIRQRFDKFGWICVSENFNVERLTKELFESIIGNKCDLRNFRYMQEKIQREISGKRVLLVLDDVWNEKKILWDLFRAPFMSAAVAKFLVTTRNDHVARMIQTEPTFNLGSLSAEQCWRLFEHYAFGGVEHERSPKLVEIGKQIMNKCGMLPLAVKSIASLLRHEGEEENWRDILESELWESTEVSNEIFPSLQISYACLPTYLKSCFLFCSMFPKDYEYYVEELVELWISQGFIVSKGNKTAERIGFEYALQLCQRSLFERADIYQGEMVTFKLHDIVHDLARVNSENSCYSIESGKVPIFPNVLYHLYIADFVNLIDFIPPDKFTDLRTLITGSYFKILNKTVDLSMAPKLRALNIFGSFHGFKISSSIVELESLSSIGNLKHLRYLALDSLSFETLPECICSLYSLQNLTLRGNPNLKELPTKIGNLMSLEELIIHGCADFAVLPESLCQLKALRNLDLLNGKLEVLPSDIWSLTDLQTLKICNTRLSYLPHGRSIFVGIQSLKVELICETIGWLKDFPGLGGALCLYNLDYNSNLMDVQCANLVSMRNLKDLVLCWRWGGYYGEEGSVLGLTIKRDDKLVIEDQSCFPVMASLQPHPNLRKLKIDRYGGNTFPEWIGSLCKLKYLNISCCNSLQFLKAESLPLALENLAIFGCHQLVSISGMEKLKSLVKFCIDSCRKLCSILGPPLEMSMSAQEGSHGSSSLGLTNHADEWHPVEPCKVEAYKCGGLEQWCLQHGIECKSCEDGPIGDGI